MATIREHGPATDERPRASRGRAGDPARAPRPDEPSPLASIAVTLGSGLSGLAAVLLLLGP